MARATSRLRKPRLRPRLRFRSLISSSSAILPASVNVGALSGAAAFAALGGGCDKLIGAAGWGPAAAATGGACAGFAGADGRAAGAAVAAGLELADAGA